MKITALVENISKGELKSKHGLSFYIETKKHKILFDLGPDKTIFKNAKKKNINISDVDIVIISHGHKDHGGALKEFLKINKKAKIYIQERAFDNYYTKLLILKIPIGLDATLKNHQQIILVNDDFKINDELLLFTVNDKSVCYSPMNNVLFNNRELDTFMHEQHLIITENDVVLFMGCGHSGVVNIMKKAKPHRPNFCIGGFHLTNPVTKKSVPNTLLDAISKHIQGYNNTQFYTCHCTGLKVFEYLQQNNNNLHYFYCGNTLEI